MQTALKLRGGGGGGGGKRSSNFLITTVPIADKWLPYCSTPWRPARSCGWSGQAAATSAARAAVFAGPLFRRLSAPAY